MVEEIAYSAKPTSPPCVAEIANFIHVMIDLIPDLVQNCAEHDKLNVHEMLSIIITLDEFIGAEHIAKIWDCLKIGINETDESVRCAAYEVFIFFARGFKTEIYAQNFAEEIYTNSLQVMENYCRG